ncbi:MAG: hypothetical protein GWO16_06090 [Gammaproteobacteria bacterium]|nr:hypothetical protein [Gammaproteobacteria bacterium]NIR97622.1 hypothetical protein [Gammaproteobacteria bacterium]NIT63272.1 hypothetical protein [Gammaproteobacteria bacterium]NIV20204.1 hypothetical protein [Gammaproteobacteria bacterium]NIY31852.1 hypothetical protein [Gammaproteobacteria bacterium]
MRLYNRLSSALLLLALAWGTAAGDEGINDAAALAGIEQARVVVPIDVPAAARYLKRVRGLHRRLREQGVEPDIVLVFLDGTVRYLTTEPDRLLAMESEDELRAIRDQLRALDRPGVRMAASRLDREAVLPQLHLVGDGLVSLIGWQHRGYSLVPVF